MTSLPCRLAIVGALAFVLAPVAARAQWYSSYPQAGPAYPYGGPQPYAVEVAPNTYVIQRPAAPRRDPSVICVRDCGEPARRPARRHGVEREAPASMRQVHNDPALIEELRKRGHVKRTIVHTTKIVRDPPLVIVHKRVVDDPPRVIVRRHYVDEPPVRRRRREASIEPPLPNQGAPNGERRVIKADAEVTILGPDRMTIRLFRKGRHAEAD